MNALFILAAGAVALVALRGGGGEDSGEIPEPDPDPGKTVTETAQRIAREASEIVDGKRDAFSDPGANGATKQAILDRVADLKGKPVPQPPAPTPQGDADALRAAKAAAAQSSGPYQPSPVKGATVSPTRQPIVKPAPYVPRPINLTPQPLRPNVGPYAAKPVAPPAPTPAGLPTGFDRAAATRAAPALAEHIRAKKFDYSRPAVKAWQTSAGVQSDGIYGPETAAALKSYTSKAPPALFKGKVS